MTIPSDFHPLVERWIMARDRIRTAYRTRNFKTARRYARIETGCLVDWHRQRAAPEFRRIACLAVAGYPMPVPPPLALAAVDFMEAYSSWDLNRHGVDAAGQPIEAFDRRSPLQVWLLARLEARDFLDASFVSSAIVAGAPLDAALLPSLAAIDTAMRSARATAA